MSNEVMIQAEEDRLAVTTRPQEMLAQVVDAVRRDSKESADAYLAETTVPHGGE